MIYKSPWCFLLSFKSIGLLDQEKKRKIDFQDGGNGGQLGFLMGMILANFVLQVTPMLPLEFQANWPFGSGEEAKNRFSRWPPWRPYWISNQNDFTYFWSTNHPDGSHSSHLGFWIRTKLASFDPQINSMLPTKFQVNWPFSSGEVKNRFSKWLRWPYWNSNWNVLANFDLQVTPMLPPKFQVNWSFGSGGLPRQPPWIYNLNNFSYFLSTSHLDASYLVLSQLAQGCSFKQLLMPHNGRQKRDAGRTLTDYNSWPWVIHAQVS